MCLGNLLFMALLAQSVTTPAGDVYAPLRLYNGSWSVMRKDAAAGAKPDLLVNKCALLGQYFACAQNVNGKPGALIVFIPADNAGRFFVQNVMPEGRATGRSDLQISGDEWTYSDRRDQDGKTTFYRTINKFSGKDRIHFESSESSDRNQWKVTMSGDEERVSGVRTNRASAR